MAAGIDVRHRKTCRGPRADGKCCDATWQGYVYNKRTGKVIRRTFPNKTAARQWRQDALVALRNGEVGQVAPTGLTIAAALDALIAGMRDGTVLDRSGRRYRPATIPSYRRGRRPDGANRRAAPRRARAAQARNGPRARRPRVRPRSRRRVHPLDDARPRAHRVGLEADDQPRVPWAAHGLGQGA